MIEEDSAIKEKDIKELEVFISELQEENTNFATKNSILEIENDKLRAIHRCYSKLKQSMKEEEKLKNIIETTGTVMR